jgi:hypothetical protein
MYLTVPTWSYSCCAEGPTIPSLCWRELQLQILQIQPEFPGHGSTVTGTVPKQRSNSMQKYRIFFASFVYHILVNPRGDQCSGSLPQIRIRPFTSVGDPWPFGADPDPHLWIMDSDPIPFFSDFLDAKKINFFIFSLITELTHRHNILKIKFLATILC